MRFRARVRVWGRVRVRVRVRILRSVRFQRLVGYQVIKTKNRRNSDRTRQLQEQS